jgi:hypothetical protein
LVICPATTFTPRDQGGIRVRRRLHTSHGHLDDVRQSGVMTA